MVLSPGFTLYAQIEAQSVFYSFPYTRESAKTFFASYVVRAAIYTVVRLATTLI
jgi:hypothetical protein